MPKLWEVKDLHSNFADSPNGSPSRVHHFSQELSQWSCFAVNIYFSRDHEASAGRNCWGPEISWHHGHGCRSSGPILTDAEAAAALKGTQGQAKAKKMRQNHAKWDEMKTGVTWMSFSHRIQLYLRASPITLQTGKVRFQRFFYLSNLELILSLLTLLFRGVGLFSHNFRFRKLFLFDDRIRIDI